MQRQKNYFLSHSVGLPFEGMEEHFAEHYFQPWHEQHEPWPLWLSALDNFRDELAQLINAERDEICPQTNLSSGLTKIVHGLPRPSPDKNVILCSAEDFPSMAFVLQKAEGLGFQLAFIEEGADLHDMSVWQDVCSDKVALCLITHVQSNNGKQLPVKEIVEVCKSVNAITIVDIAQSIGLFKVDTKHWQADFILGSCVKWLCGGPGAAYLWVNPAILERCEPVDVGWFSHENPFEFDVRNFDYAPNALRFWGGTPSVAAYVHAAFAIYKVNAIGIQHLRNLNWGYLKQIHNAVASVDPAYIQSPTEESKCSGTAIIHYGGLQDELIAHLNAAEIAFDQRPNGIRLSPHHYTKQTEMDALIKCLILK